MQVLMRLATGQIALWRVFWLFTAPLKLLWVATGACMVLGIGVEEPLLTGVIIALFAVASVALPFAAVALWRSASNYPQAAWWQKLLAIGAKLCAVLFGLIGALSVVGLLYLASEFIQAALA
jgi:hypothetical protein